jgi:zinc transport system ATP-binding protein
MDGNTANNSRVIVQVEHADFSWDGNEVLHDCNLEVRAGQFLGLLGPNGGGKTTLIRLILGELVPDQGRVLVFGREAHRLGPERRLIGYVPQRERAEVNFPATALDTVVMGTFSGLGFGRRVHRAQREAARRILELMGIPDVADQPLRQLSSGQQQRVFVARALVNRPELLLVDEPTVGMDVGGQESFFEELHALQEEMRMTVIMATHDIDHIRHVAGWLACVSRQIYWHGPSEELTKDELHVACELGAYDRHVGMYHVGEKEN